MATIPDFRRFNYEPVVDSAHRFAYRNLDPVPGEPNLVSAGDNGEGGWAVYAAWEDGREVYHDEHVGDREDAAFAVEKVMEHYARKHGGTDKGTDNPFHPDNMGGGDFDFTGGRL